MYVCMYISKYILDIGSSQLEKYVSIYILLYISIAIGNREFTTRGICFHKYIYIIAIGYREFTTRIICIHKYIHIYPLLLLIGSSQ